MAVPQRVIALLIRTVGRRQRAGFRDLRRTAQEAPLRTLLEEAEERLLLPALCAAVLTAGLFARIDVYGAFVRGAKAGMETLLQMAPCLCAVLTLTALLRETGLLGALTEALRPALEALRLPGEAAAVVLLRPLSGSAALAAVSDVMARMGADSRAARLCCVISGASETVFFTASLYLGAAAVALCRSGGAAGLRGGGVGGGMAGLRKKR